jgi:CRISPR-associated protein Cmr2
MGDERKTLGTLGGKVVSRSLLLFTLGPVQSFIEQARKTRDLWMGSFLLSTLMQAAMSHLRDSRDSLGKPRLVFPSDPTTSGKIPDLPNKFVAVLESEAEAREAAREAERRLRERWNAIAVAVWQHLTEWAPDIKQAKMIWDRQVIFESFFEVYWAIALEQPGEQKEKLYGVWLTRAQRALDARKRLRDFVQQEEVEPGEKSTISGERQALRGSKGDIESVRAFWAEIAGKYPPAQISHNGKERLDAIDAIKRCATVVEGIPDLPFPSTSTVAAAPFIAALLKQLPGSQSLNEAVKAWKDLTSYDGLAKGANPSSLPYLEALAAQSGDAYRDLLKRDGDCYFPETFTPQRLEENYGLPNFLKSAEQLSNVPKERLDRTRALVAQAPGVLSRLREALPEEQSRLLTPYYAILVMDGDHMGEFLSNVADRDIHRSVSGALSHFSRELVPPLVERDHPAKLVYAGGDDVLALVPIRHVLPLADAIQNAYRQAMRPHRPAGYSEEKVTMSAGIAIAHYLDPLSHVLREARLAEKAAKEAYGRDAVVVTLLRRSGEPTTVGCKWRYDLSDEKGNPDVRGQPLDVFQDMADLLACGVISTNFVYNLAQEAATLSQLDTAAQKSEIRRLLRRGSNEDQFKSRQFQALDDKMSSALREQWEHLPSRLARLAEKMSLDQRRLPLGGLSAGADRKPFEYRQMELWQDGPRRGLVEISGWLLLEVFSLRGRAD